MKNYLDPGLIKTVTLTMRRVVMHLEEDDEHGWAKALLVFKNVEEIMLIENLGPGPVNKSQGLSYDPSQKHRSGSMRTARPATLIRTDSIEK